MEILNVLKRELQRIEPTIDVGAVALDADIADLGIDSVTMLEVVSAFEQLYGAYIPDDELTAVSTLRDLVEAIGRHADSRVP
jgi:acyl carrier protein